MVNRLDILAAMRRDGRRRKVPGLIKADEPSLALENELLRIVGTVVRAWRDQLAQTIMPAYGEVRPFIADDAPQDAMETAMEQANSNVLRVVLTLRSTVEGWILRFEEWHRKRWRSRVKDATGVDVWPFLDEAAARPQLDLALQANVNLIRGLSDDLRKNVQTLIWGAFRDQVPRRVLAKQLDHAIKVGKSRAELIARDQTVKLAADLDRLRQEELGFDRYVWRTMRDDRVRPNHRSKEGKVFFWSKPPADTGHPGHDINCRCKAQAYLPPDDEQ